MVSHLRGVSVARDIEPRSTLARFGDVVDALARLPVPAFAVRRDGTIAWLNRAARELLGEREGVAFTQIVAAESVHVVRTELAREILGSAPSAEYEATLLKKDGSTVRAEVSSVPVADEGHIVGIFGVASVDRTSAPLDAASSIHQLTPRQTEVLRLLARGCSTEQLADELGVAVETARNHVRGVLRRLGVHSRLEAVIRAYRDGLI
jgi:PAS domain S-box-containing protein